MNYRLTRNAESDLREIARYTLKTWGEEQFSLYKSGLSDIFNAIGAGKIIAKRFSQRFPGLLVTKYQHHYIFYQTEGFDRPVILSIIHERRDIVKKLADRLD